MKKKESRDRKSQLILPFKGRPLSGAFPSLYRSHLPVSWDPVRLNVRLNDGWESASVWILALPLILSAKQE